MVSVVTVMGMSLHRITRYTYYVYTFRGYTSLIADEDKREYIPEKRVFQSIVFGALHVWV